MVVQTQGDDEGAHLAMEKLCANYWPPLYAFARRSGSSKEDAEDATQAFFTRMIGGAYLNKARKEKGKLRSFLLTCFKHYLSDERDKSKAQKRGGNSEILSFDAAALEEVIQADECSPERAYDRGWANAVLDAAMEDLRDDYAKRGKDAQFEALKGFLTDDGGGYREVAEKLEMRENAIGVAVFRMRKRFGELMKQQVLATVVDEQEVVSELRHLMEALA